jgi:hypothetical protein
MALSAHAGVIYSNYGPGFSYDTNTAWIVDYPGTGFNPAMPFTPTATATLDAIYLNVGNDLGTSSLDITLRTDSGGIPGAVIESFNVTSVPDALNGVTFAPLQLKSSLNPILSAGQQYWIAATANDLGAEFGWWESNADIGQVFSDQNGSPGFSTGRRGVFELTSAPEPIGSVLAMSGILLVFTRRVFSARL